MVERDYFDVSSGLALPVTCLPATKCPFIVVGFDGHVVTASTKEALHAAVRDREDYVRGR